MNLLLDTDRNCSSVIHLHSWSHKHRRSIDVETQLILCSNGLEIFPDSLIVNLIIFYKG